MFEKGCRRLNELNSAAEVGKSCDLKDIQAVPGGGRPAAAKSIRANGFRALRIGKEVGMPKSDFDVRSDNSRDGR